MGFQSNLEPFIFQLGVEATTPHEPPNSLDSILFLLVYCTGLMALIPVTNKTLLYFPRIPGDLMKVVFSVAAQTEDGWTTLLDFYKHSVYDSEKRKTLEALSSTQDVRKIVW